MIWSYFTRQPWSEVARSPNESFLSNLDDLEDMGPNLKAITGYGCSYFNPVNDSKKRAHGTVVISSRRAKPSLDIHNLKSNILRKPNKEKVEQEKVNLDTAKQASLDKALTNLHVSDVKTVTSRVGKATAELDLDARHIRSRKEIEQAENFLAAKEVRNSFLNEKAQLRAYNWICQTSHCTVQKNGWSATANCRGMAVSYVVLRTYRHQPVVNHKAASRIDYTNS